MALCQSLIKAFEDRSMISKHKWYHRNLRSTVFMLYGRIYLSLISLLECGLQQLQISQDEKVAQSVGAEKYNDCISAEG